MGGSGCGKSTLLSTIGLLDERYTGTYKLFGKDIAKYSEKEKASIRNNVFGFVMQDFALIDEYTVFENVEIPLIYSKNKKYKNKNDRYEYIKKTLKILDIEEKIDSKCTELSGGQRQRVAIARAIINDAKIIIADEPTGALDEKSAEGILKILKKVNDMLKITLIMVTHDKSVAQNCDKIYRLENGKL
jgi:putative ABC transport system ATP-binding protein